MVSRESPYALGGFGRRLANLTGWVFVVRHPYENELQQQRALALSVMSSVFGVLGLFGTIGILLFFPQVMSLPLLILNIFLALLYLGVYALVQRGLLGLASFIFVIMVLIVPTVQSVPFAFLDHEMVVLGLTIPVISAALLLGPGWALVAALLGSVAIGIVTYAEYVRILETLRGSALNVAVNDLVVTGLISIFLLGMLSLFAWLLANGLFRWAQSAQRRARQIEAAAAVGETAASAKNVGLVLNVLVERIRDAFDFYHAQVFLLDIEKRIARLEASTGKAGVALLARGHALPVGSRSVIGQCTYRGEPVVVNDVSLSAFHRPNELLPDTRAEMALPLLVENEVIGALDIQSTEVDAFQLEDIRSLQLMSNQIAIAIERARLVNEMETRAEENQRLFEEAQRNLRQIEDLNRQLTREGWRDYLRARRVHGRLAYSLQEGQVQQDVRWTAPMRQAFQGEKSVIIRHDQQAHIAAVPVRVRGEVIGVLEIERGGDQPWTDQELEMAETLVERLGLALENARLYEQATLAVEREQIVNRISQEVQQAESIDDVLQTALAELSSALGVSRGIVQISPKAEQEPEVAVPEAAPQAADVPSPDGDEA